jgi:hypothetical protein
VTLPSLRILRLALIACALCAGVAQAAPVTFDFTGAVTDDPFGVSHFGAPISGSFSFDSDAPDVIADPATGGYFSQGPAFSLTAIVDGTAYSAVGSLFVGVVNTGSDEYSVVAGNGSTTLELLFEDASGTAFASDALPASVSLAAFAFRQFRLFGGDAEILGSVDTLTPVGVAAPVPEPATFALLGAGLLLLPLRRRVLAPLGVAAALLTALPAFAIDGVILIDQGKALAGSVTPGDAPGFPITISRPGSYRLASNLTVADVNTSAIQIAADNVTLDLNGFAILGPVDCSSGCTSFGSGSGVQTSAQPHFNITIRNGTIQGMGSHGIELTGDSNLVEQVAARGNGNGGISLVDSAGSPVGGPSAVRHSMAVRNGGLSGITVARGVASFNTSSLNAGVGISVQIGSALYNIISENKTGGLSIGRGNYIGNNMDFNENLNVFGAGVNQGQNLCDGFTCGRVVF